MKTIALAAIVLSCLSGPALADAEGGAAKKPSPTTQPDAATDAPTSRPDEPADAPAATQPDTPGVLAFTMLDIEGRKVDLSRYHGRVVLMVNVASKCGLTPQYEQLQALHRTYGGKGLSILGFPANEFGQQEPGANEQIKQFCETRFGVEFDMFAKVVVKGEGICPLYAFLTGRETNGRFAGPIRWNFTKFLISREGEVVARFEPRVGPASKRVLSAIEAELDRPAPTSRPDGE